MSILLALPETLRRTNSSAGAGEERDRDLPIVGSPRSGRSRLSPREVFDRRKGKCTKIFRIAFVDPLKLLLYLRFPAVLLTVYYASITFGSMYVLNISVQTTFERPPYNFKTLIVGFLYFPAALGYLIASIGGGRWMDSIMAREARKAARFDDNGAPAYRPEDRMRENAWLGAIFYPLALVVYGWTVQREMHWIVPVCDPRCEVYTITDPLLC